MKKNPPRASRRRLPALVRKEHLLQIALPLFARDGFYGVTTKELAQTARISEALLFKHYPTKRALYAAIFHYCERFLELDETRIPALVPSTETLVKIVYSLTRGILVKRSAGADPTFRLYYRSYLEDGDFACRLLKGARFTGMRAKFVASFKAGVRRGDIRSDHAEPGNEFWFAVNIPSMIYLQRLPAHAPVNYGRKLDDLVRDATHFALRGIGLTSAAIRRHASAANFARWAASPADTLFAEKPGLVRAAGAVSR